MAKLLENTRIYRDVTLMMTETLSIAIKKRYRKDYEVIRRIKEEDKRQAAA